MAGAGRLEYTSHAAQKPTATGSAAGRKREKQNKSHYVATLR